jgi:hypothetical protein
MRNEISEEAKKAIRMPRGERPPTVSSAMVRHSMKRSGVVSGQSPGKKPRAGRLCQADAQAHRHRARGLTDAVLERRWTRTSQAARSHRSSLRARLADAVRDRR